MLLTQPDRDRLINLLRTHDAPRPLGLSSARLMLQTTMNTAAVVSSSAIPATVVTMNSILSLIDLANGLTKTCALVYPNDADIDRLKISVLAPLGAALLGRSQGDIVEFTVPAGTKRYLVQKVLYQPEAQRNQPSGIPTAL